MTSAIANNFGFPGQVWDEEAGLWQNWFRDYDHRTGRYVEGDPIGLGGGVNGYVYASSNTTAFVDLLGLAVQGSWIDPPSYNITGVGVDDWGFVAPSFSSWGYVKFVRLYGHVSGYINIDVKCVDDCSMWEVHKRIYVGGREWFDVGPNIPALAIGATMGPWAGLSLNIAIGGSVSLQAEQHYLSLAWERAGFLIRGLYRKGPTAICHGIGKQ